MEIELYSLFVSLNRRTYSFIHLCLFFGILRSRIIDRVFEAISEEPSIFVERNFEHFARESDIKIYLPGHGKQSANMLHEHHVTSVISDVHDEHCDYRKAHVQLDEVIIVVIILDEIVTRYDV